MKQYLIITTICIIAAFLRFQGLSSSYQFLGDQGRDARVMKEMLEGKRLQLVGPTMSLGGFYLGPLFYYITAPSLWIANFNPVGPALFTAVLGVTTVALLFWCMRTFSAPAASWAAALGAAVDPTLVHFSRFAWNPNLIPFFVVLWLYAALKYRRTHTLKWWYILGVMCAVLIQLHYVTVLLLAVSIVMWIQSHKKLWSRATVLPLLIFSLPSLISLSPSIYTFWTTGIQGVLSAVAAPTTHASFQTHYILFLLPLVYAAAGIGVTYLYSQLPQARVLIVTTSLAAVLLLLERSSHPEILPESVQHSTRSLVMQSIVHAAQGEPFQLAVLSQISNDEPYRYLYSLTDIQPVTAPDTATQLFIVCEDDISCKPFGNPHYEIARFAVDTMGKEKVEEVVLKEPAQVRRIQLVK